MVDTSTWNNLSPEEQAEHRALAKNFIRAVKASGVADGTEFERTYKILSKDGFYFLSNGGEPFAGITSRHRKVIEALQTDAAQNYGR